MWGDVAQTCEETLPTTGRRCDKLATIMITRFNEPFSLCQSALWRLLPQRGMDIALYSLLADRPLVQVHHCRFIAGISE
jgi:hypothetical protein